MGNRDDIQRAQAGRATWNMWARGHRKNGTTYDVDFSGEIIEEPPKPAPADDEADKVARLPVRR